MFGLLGIHPLDGHATRVCVIHMCLDPRIPLTRLPHHTPPTMTHMYTQASGATTARPPPSPSASCWRTRARWAGQWGIWRLDVSVHGRVCVHTYMHPPITTLQTPQSNPPQTTQNLPAQNSKRLLEPVATIHPPTHKRPPPPQSHPLTNHNPTPQHNTANACSSPSRPSTTRCSSSALRVAAPGRRGRGCARSSSSSRRRRRRRGGWAPLAVCLWMRC